MIWVWINLIVVTVIARAGVVWSMVDGFGEDLAEADDHTGVEAELVHRGIGVDAYSAAGAAEVDASASCIYG